MASGGVNAVEGKRRDGRTSPFRRPPARGRAHDRGLPRLRHIPQDRRQALRALQGRGRHRARRSLAPAPGRYANQLPPPVESLIVACKREKPWGARKIRELLVGASPARCAFPLPRRKPGDLPYGHCNNIPCDIDLRSVGSLPFFELPTRGGAYADTLNPALRHVDDRGTL
jgi:hypothetical protein